MEQLLTILAALCAVTCLMHTQAQLSNIEFRAEYYPGLSMNFSFPQIIASECVYGRSPDLLTCMADFTYHKIREVWRAAPGNISYVKLNCLKQESYSSYRHVCFCKNSTLADNPSAGVQGDKFYSCQLTTLQQGAFQYLSNLQVLDLSDNQLFEIPSEAFKGLENVRYITLQNNSIHLIHSRAFCHLPRLTFLDLSGSLFFKFPREAFTCGYRVPSSPIKVLLMNTSNIVSIPRILSGLHSLVYLDLSMNKIRLISSSSFNQSISLEYLDLSYNSLRDLPDNICKQIPRLKTLLLGHNIFTSIDMSMFAGCRDLEMIDFSYNRIYQISGEVDAIVSLKVLLLRHNNLSHLHNNLTIGAASHLQELDLSDNQIHHLTGLIVTFQNATNLEQLNLSRNFLSENETDLDVILKPLGKLKLLDLSFNQFRSIQATTFSTLGSLETLDLHENEITTLEVGCFSELENITDINLSKNNIRGVPAGAFIDMLSLTTLELSFNRIEATSPLTFPINLEHLDMSHNMLNMMPELEFHETELNETVNSLVTLNLHNNRITNITFNSSAVHYSLKSLDLGRNQITHIQQPSFASLWFLETLNLHHNELSVNFNTDPFWGAPNLRTVNLAYNLITNVNGLFDASTLRNVEHLNMTGNPLSEITRDLNTYGSDIQLKTVILDNCDLLTVNYATFADLTHLQNVSLQDNRFREFRAFLTAHPVEFDLRRNSHLECTCNMKWLSGMTVVVWGNTFRVSNYKMGECHNDALGYPMRVYDVEEEDFVCISTRDCDNDACVCFIPHPDALPSIVRCDQGLTHPPSMISPIATRVYMAGNDFSGISILGNIGNGDVPCAVEELHLNNSRIHALHKDIFLKTSDLRLLYLHSNLLVTVPSMVFTTLVKLEELYLNDNLLESLHPGTFTTLKKLSVLDLRGNRLQWLPGDVFHGLHLAGFRFPTEVYLSHNPWECSCILSSFHAWLHTNRNFVPDWEEVQCSGLIVVDVNPSQFECGESGLTTDSKGYIISFILIAILLIVLGFIVFRLRKEIFAIAFAKCGCACQRPHWGRDALYDAYIIHDSRDPHTSKWVKDVLLPELERGIRPYKVYIPERDALPGEDISDTSSEMIRSSRRTLAVISDTFDCNLWCKRTFQLAYEHMIADRNHRVIPIRQGALDIDDCEHILKVFYMMGRFLDSRSRFMWLRLRYEMPDPQPGNIPVPERSAGVSEHDVIIDNAIDMETEEFTSAASSVA